MVGRQHNKELFMKLGFILKKDGRKYTAMCQFCHKQLKNTAGNRLRGHRNFCTRFSQFKMIEIHSEAKENPFDKKVIIQLIDLYQHHQCLWDMSIESSKDLKNKAWMDISKKLGIAVDEVKKRIKILCAAYTAEIKNNMDPKSCYETNTSNVCNNKLAWFEKMHFLDDIIKAKFGHSQKIESATAPKIEYEEITRGYPEEEKQSYPDSNNDNVYVNNVEAIQNFSSGISNPLSPNFTDNQNVADSITIEDDIMEDDDEVEKLINFRERNVESSTTKTLFPNSKKLITLQEEKTKAETEYFRKKATYFEKQTELLNIQRKLMVLQAQKLQLEIEKIRNDY